MSYPAKTIETLQERLVKALGTATFMEVVRETRLTPEVLVQMSRDARMWNTVSLNQLRSMVRLLVPGSRLDNARCAIEEVTA